MMAQNLTRLTVVMVLLGVILALAVFRPPILPLDLFQSTGQSVEAQENTSTPGLSEDVTPTPENQPISEEELNRLKQELDQRQTGLDEREVELDRRETELDELQYKLNQRRAGLDEREDALDQQELGLAGREVALDQRELELDDREAKLEEQDAALQAWEEGLTEREQELERRIRLSRAVTVTGALLVVTAVLIFIASMRQNQKTSAKDAQPPAHPSRPSQREREAQRYRPAVLVPISSYGGNGRNRESMGSALGRRTENSRCSGEDVP